MKKGILLFVGLLLMSGVAWGQVISDFNTPGVVGNWEKGGDSGPGLDSLTQMADPSNPSNGVMAVHFSFDSTQWHGRFDYGSLGNATYIAANGAQFITFWVYLDSTQNIPDSLKIDTYCMTNGTWAWTEDTHYAMDIPKNVWFPLSFPLGEHFATNPNFDIINNQFMTGLQMFPPTTTTWRGTIYVDNIALIGAKPDYLGQFDLGQPLGNWEKGGDSGPGLDSLTVVADPTDITNGVMAVHFSFDSLQWHGRFDYGSLGNAAYVGTDSALFMTFWVYLDSAQNIPDSLKIDTYAMTNGTWAWTEDIHYARDIPKNVWYPLSFPLAAHYAQNPNFDIVNHQIMFGLQMQPIDTTWRGIIYVDNISLLSHITAPPPAVWLAADFENEKKAGFHLSSGSIGTLSVVLDEATSNASMVLQAAANFATGTHKLAVLRDSIEMQSGVDSTVTDISFEMYIPSKMPVGANVIFYVSGGAGDSVASTYQVGTTLQRNNWNTIRIENLDSLAGLGQFDPGKPATIGILVSYPTDSSTFSGNIWFDNLTIYGVWFSTVLDVSRNNGLVSTYELYNNYPNPFNPSTVIRYDVPKQAKVLVQVFDILGREVATLVNEVQVAGQHEVAFNASSMASGVYFFRMTSGGFVKTQRMMLLK